MKNKVNCKICSSESEYIFSSVIRNRYKIKYYFCNNCGFLQTEDPFWLDEAYRESINLSDTGLIQRNILFSKITTDLIYLFIGSDKKYLDYAGGYGIFTRIMRDIGFDYYWDDIYTTNLFSKGFEYKKEIGEISLITSFESFEHFVNPIKEIEKMLEISSNIFFSTEIIPNIVPKPYEWSYYGLSHGQHISFYSLKSLELISKKYKLNLYSNKVNLHLLTKKKINPLLFKIIINKSEIIYHFIKNRLKSKTMDDSLFLMKWEI